MKTNYLLPNKYKLLGWILFSLGIAFGLYFILGDFETEPLKIKVLSIFHNLNGGPKEFKYFEVIENGIAFEITLLAIIIGGLIIGFSKEKTEDEFISKLRNESLVWAIVFNYLILILGVIFVYDFTFLDVLLFNMFTPLIFFIIRFNFLKHKSISDEE
jgi:hypothetical protein